jgi:hypothetical protein
MAPEQAAGRAQEIDALTDIWAVGATMFQLLTQRLVHDVSSNNGTIVAAATVPAPRIQSLCPSIPGDIAQIVDRALAFERSKRWPNARAMHLALRTACPEIAHVAFVEPHSQETVPEQEPHAAQLDALPSHTRLKLRLGVLVALPMLVLLSAWVLRKEARLVRLSTRAVESPAPSATAPVALSSARILIAQPATATQPPVVAPILSSSAISKAIPAVSSLTQSSGRRGKPPLPINVSPPTDNALLDRRK